jgi:hypothetical protein
MKQTKYILINHACNKCGGRILAPSNGTGISGYTSYICSCCEISGSGLLNPPFCYCNQELRGAEVSTYRCVHKDELSKAPWLLEACAHSGYLIDSDQKVGLVSLEAENHFKERWEREHGDEINILRAYHNVLVKVRDKRRSRTNYNSTNK